MTEPPRHLALVRDYQGLQTALRARVTELETTHEAIGDLAGLQDGYAGKLLAPCPIKALGEQSLGPMLSVLGIALIVVEDLDAVRRISSRLKKRENASGAMRPMGRRGKRRYPKLGSEWSVIMNAKRTLKMSVTKRKRSARAAAKARWKKPRVVEVKPKSKAKRYLGVLLHTNNDTE